MELNDYFVINQSGEIFLKVTADDLNQDFLSQANKSLAEQFAHAERKCQTNKYIDARDAMIGGLIVSVLWMCIFLSGIFLTIFLDLGCIVILFIAPIFIAISTVMFYRNRNKLRQIQSGINRGELLICEKISPEIDLNSLSEIALTSLNSDLQYRYSYNGQEITRTCKVKSRAWRYYLPLPYVIIAYDNISGQSYPVRLFLNKETKT